MTVKRTESIKENDRMFIAELMLKSVPLWSMREQLQQKNIDEKIFYKDKTQTLSTGLIGKECQLILKQWRSEREEYIDDRLDLEIKKLDKIEEECWIAWEKSLKGTRKTKLKGGTFDENDGTYTGGKLKERQLETNAGEVKYLERIQWCIDKRLEILGFKVKKIDITSTGKRITGAGVVKISYGDLNK